jgi:hypothetical protein
VEVPSVSSPVAHDEEAGLGVEGGDRGRRGEEVLDPLALDEPGQDRDHRRSLRQSELLAEARTSGPRCEALRR